jgi:2-dehydro-3-deoxyphosphogluconate aldolase/(4S)-4-hydroxy-2-oxoglutarate aldolase
MPDAKSLPSVADLAARTVPLIPVLHVEDPADASALAEALVGSGLVLLEVTLRTARALEVIEAMRKAAPQAVVGAGTVTRPEQFARVRDAGAAFAVSPALTDDLAEAAHAAGIPYLPGTATPTEMLRARELGFTELKFFPADLYGGPAALNHVAPLYPELKFCPTGGVSDANSRTYLGLPNCFATGGAWLAPRAMIEARQWTAIAELARKAVATVKAG